MGPLVTPVSVVEMHYGVGWLGLNRERRMCGELCNVYAQ
jgi:hypothetical protein